MQRKTMLEVYQIEAFEDNYIYALKSDDHVAVIDPGDAYPVLAFLEDMGWELQTILITHHHHDHTGGNLILQKEFGCNIVGFQGDQNRIPGITALVKEGDEVTINSAIAHVIEIPGHTTGHIAYYFEEDGLLFCGDTLFSLGCGRLFEGTPEQMWNSLKKLRTLPDETLVFCAHEYTQHNGSFALTIEPNNPDLNERCEDVDDLRYEGLPTVPSLLGVEKKTNPFLRADNPEIMKTIGTQSPLECFTELRQRKDRF